MTLIEMDGTIASLLNAQEQLGDSQSDVVLDFSKLARVDAAAIAALQQFATKAEQKGAHVTLRNVNVDVYKVLKLVKLTRRFTFAE